MKKNRLCAGFILSSFLAFFALGGTESSAQELPMIEILVTGRQPGPPLWRVRNGENELYLFARIEYVPAGMELASTRVEAVIASSEEFIGAPDYGYSFSGSPGNRLTLIPRMLGLMRELRRNPNGERLQDVLPPLLYQRFGSLKSQHFRRNRPIEKLNPRAASALMAELILKDEGLATSLKVDKTLRKLMNRNKDAVRTTPRAMDTMDGGFKEFTELMIAARDQSMPEAVACFARRLEQMESEVAATKYRANAWARGDIDEFRGGPLPGSAETPCTSPLLSIMDPAIVERLEQQSRQQWLDAAEQALSQSRSSFAILHIRELLSEDGLLAELGNRGYEIREP